MGKMLGGESVSAIVNSAHFRVSNARLNGLSADPSVPSMCHRGSGRVVVVLISTIAVQPESKSMQTLAKSSQSVVHTLPRNWAKTRIGFAGCSNRQI